MAVDFVELTGEQTRQMIDVTHVYDALVPIERELDRRFKGSMSWKTVRGRNYLYRKPADQWVSLGPKSESTETAFAAFHGARAELKTQAAALECRLQAMAPVNRAMKLGRVDPVAARILRRLDAAGVLGHGLSVVGTHALYAYERMVGVQYGGGVIATRDIDLLYDARGRLNLVGSGLNSSGLIGVLRSADRSFKPVGKGSFRAVNADGFMVDLITPLGRGAATQRIRRVLGDAIPDDLAAAEIVGLGWLESAPSTRMTILDERGFPLSIVVPDPRAFACHKAWLGQRADREPAKRRRDLAQATVVARTVAIYLPNLRFDDPQLNALPAQLRAAGAQLASQAARPIDPDWR